MKRLRKLLLACAIVPLSQIAIQAAARAEEGGFVVAQADPPACQPGDANCVPAEKVVPPQEQKPEVQPEPPAPKPEAEPPSPAPQPEIRPEAPAPLPEAQPEPAAPKQEVKPERPAPQPEASPEAPAPLPEAQPESPAPKQQAKPERPAPEPQAQPEPPTPNKETKPERPVAAPEASPEPMAPTLDSEPKASAPEPKARPERPASKPDKRPERPVPSADTTPPTPDSKPMAPAPEAQPKPAIPAPAGTSENGASQPLAPDAAAPGTPPPLPVQPGDQPPPDSVEKQAPPPALIEKLGNPGAAAAEAIDQSVGQKAGNIRDVQRDRRVISDEDGVRVTVEPGSRVIVQSGEQAVIRHDDRGRFDRGGRDYRERPTRDGGREVIVATRDGGEVRTVYDENGTMIQRERRDRDGRVYVLFDNRSFGPGPVDEPVWQPVVRLPPPPAYDMPRDRYRVEMRSAPPLYVEEALTAPPLVEVQPEYTLDQVIYSPDLRERVRSVDLDSITFPSGAWVVEQSQIASLDAVARGIEAALHHNPNEVFLVEGYTDAVGSVVDNLSLSDRRAEAVANVLTDHYGIPPENLVTQGYGESYLKIQTEGPERANRRVMVRRITPLLTTKGQQ